MATGQKKIYGITIDTTRDENLDDLAINLLKNHYLNDDENSPQEAFARAAVAFSNGDMDLAQRVYDYASRGWFMYSSPVLSNAPKPGEKVRALPISCFLNYVDDTVKGLIDHTSELRWLSIMGGGVGAHWSNVRAVSKKAPGPMPFIHTVDADMIAYRQGKTRKGAYAAYMDISHPDIIEFIKMRIPTGDVNRKNLNLHHGVNLSDSFMKAVRNGDKWDLKDPHSKEVRDVVSARELWETLLETRYRTGEPYIVFIDTAIAAMPPEQKKLGLMLHGSNLCSEIMLPTNKDRTAVCCLSSLNLEHYDDWKNSSMVYDLTVFLDNVLQHFIDNAPDEIAKARYSAECERSLGLGAMGYHSYLQRKNIPFVSDEAVIINKEIFESIYKESERASLDMGASRGEAPDMVGSGHRNAHRLAIAPNANSSMILGTSPSIEPWKANAFTSRSRVGSYLKKNVYLERVLEGYGKNTKDIWKSIMANAGSVSHLDFLTERERAVFATANEIDQVFLVTIAGDRQKFICQGQSLNVFFPALTERKYIHDVHFKAWEAGCKALYYLRTDSSNRAENVGAKVEREKLDSIISPAKGDDEPCLSCEG